MKRLYDIGINGFELPVVVKHDIDYYIIFKEHMSSYLNYISRKSDNYLTATEDCISRTAENINAILRSLTNYNNADITSAKNNIKDIIERYLDNPFFVADINNNYAFRGVAPVALQPDKYKYKNEYKELYELMNKHDLSFFKARKSIEDLTRTEMLHIPFDSRHKISTQRFSLPGVPCLYLATTTLGCWIELGMPDFDLFQVTAYKLPNDLKILNLCLSAGFINGNVSDYINEEEFGKACSLIELYPLIYATSFKVQDENRIFKSEYIVSQLLMQIAKEMGIDGVAYFSKKMNESIAFPQCVNLAILMNSNVLPPFNNPKEKYWEFASKLKLTNPIRMSSYKDALKKKILDKNIDRTYLCYSSEIYKNADYHNTVSILGSNTKYTSTIFSEFDEIVLGQEFEYFD